ncbi:hypothetical protein HPB50_000510 [Hyalomma asiaticum]|uniref:Uncharacterized protein n=1 Tax=Hyalomma asiaticum TaxID=266040 RepID=A0ACB7T3A6_HYAAI|nr:hypothetical protein HPB50_000510 [Hyalomma asiaticum]
MEYYIQQDILFAFSNAVLAFFVGSTLPSWRTEGAHAVMLPKDPDAEKSIEELIEARGYPVESREVVTDDGYVLGLYRIPRGRLEVAGSTSQECDDSAGRPPVLLMHGLLSSAIPWVSNYPDQSIGFVLADAGYDVWLGNVRGCTLARKHVRINPDSDVSFWNFSVQEMIEYDLPATIDYVLRETGHSRLGYVGHSQGTLIMFGLLSSVPAYNDKVRSALLKIGEMGEYGPLWKELADTPCRTKELMLLCESMCTFTFGPTVMANVLVITGRFCKYDYGAARNKGIYGQATPPCYHLEKIRAPVAIFWGQGDKFSRPEDIDRIRARVSSIVVDERVGSGPFNHVDYLYGVDAKRVLHDRVVQVLGQYYSNACRDSSQSRTTQPHEHAQS